MFVNFYGRIYEWRISLQNSQTILASYSPALQLFGNGYHRTPSRYSEVCCTFCGLRWRTDAEYVNRLPDITESEKQYQRSR